MWPGAVRYESYSSIGLSVMEVRAFDSASPGDDLAVLVKLVREGIAPSWHCFAHASAASEARLQGPTICRCSLPCGCRQDRCHRGPLGKCRQTKSGTVFPIEHSCWGSKGLQRMASRILVVVAQLVGCRA